MAVLLASVMVGDFGIHQREGVFGASLTSGQTPAGAPMLMVAAFSSACMAAQHLSGPKYAARVIVCMGMVFAVPFAWTYALMAPEAAPARESIARVAS